MARIRIAATIPYHLLLPDGRYLIPRAEPVFLRRVGAVAPGDGIPARTEVHSFFETVGDLTREAAEEVAFRQANGLVTRLNRLLRWYRFLGGRPDVVELIPAQMSPFLFTLDPGPDGWVFPRLDYESPGLPPKGFPSIQGLGEEVRKSLEAGMEPDAAQLTLLDAEYAMTTGRFRDAVLLCWSVIDSSIQQAFERQVDQRLAGEWGESLDFLKSADYGLRHKMTSGLKLLCGRSLFEDKKLWESLSQSYRKRNDIIHRNQSAEVADARGALQVARQVLAFLQAVQA